ncbi:MAG TPA: hypothetical protein VLX68_02275 [Chitinivibrionales bacterium]|nr:hypothetical protein [Chitinivibrionales bacterium]
MNVYDACTQILSSVKTPQSLSEHYNRLATLYEGSEDRLLRLLLQDAMARISRVLPVVKGGHCIIDGDGDVEPLLAYCRRGVRDGKPSL